MRLTPSWTQKLKALSVVQRLRTPDSVQMSQQRSKVVMVMGNRRRWTVTNDDDPFLATRVFLLHKKTNVNKREYPNPL